ncbi:MAG: hypothetical protein U9N77_00885, partial [Thermodesulfobacteriota bacterium]|nr:hypothetical protein [Thermodesulfobacteriota bacterium]
IKTTTMDVIITDHTTSETLPRLEGIKTELCDQQGHLLRSESETLPRLEGIKTPANILQVLLIKTFNGAADTIMSFIVWISVITIGMFIQVCRQ